MVGAHRRGLLHEQVADAYIRRRCAARRVPGTAGVRAAVFTAVMKPLDSDLRPRPPTPGQA